MLLTDSSHPCFLIGASQLAVDRGSDSQVVLGVPSPELARFAQLLELLRRIVADHLEHPEAPLGTAKKALLDERLEGVQVGLGHPFGRLERAAAGENRKPSK